MAISDISHFLAFWTNALSNDAANVRTVAHPNGSIYVYCVANTDMPIHFTPTALCDIAESPCVVVWHMQPGIEYPYVYSVTLPMSTTDMPHPEWLALSSILRGLIIDHYKFNSKVNVQNVIVHPSHPVLTITPDGVSIGLKNGVTLYDFYFTRKPDTTEITYCGVDVYVPIKAVYSPQCIAYLPLVCDIAKGNVKAKARTVSVLHRRQV